MTDHLARRYRIHPTCAWRRIDDHVFVLNDLDAFVTLDDPVALVVWQALEEGPCDGEALLSRIVARFEVGEQQARDDLAQFLSHLVQERGLDLA